MYDSDEKVEKGTVEVQVDLDNGTQILGALFVKQMQRISDLLNDPRTFLPLRTASGIIVHLRKAAIAKVVQLDQTASRYPSRDPYEILGVPESVSDADLQAAYHDLCTKSHPDKLLALGLPVEFIDLANSRLIRIIDAYRSIQSVRRAANGNGADADPASDPA
jgi:preprotein translocase subunit Sec63